MKGQITGIHHLALRPPMKDYNKTVSFYTDILGMEVIRTWGGDDKPCCMISIGSGSCMEILSEPDGVIAPEGVFQHVAFATKYVDEIVSRVRDAGYEITTEPADIVIDSAEKKMDCRIAFFKGPLNEIIELFYEKN